MVWTLPCSSRVDYRVEVGKGRTKVLHINNLKKFYVREEEILRLAVVAEDCEKDEAIGVKVRGRCEDFDERQLEELKKDFGDVFVDIPGRTSVCQHR